MIDLVVVNYENEAITTKGFVLEISRFFALHVLASIGIMQSQVHFTVVLFPVSFGISFGGFHKLPRGKPA